MFLLERRPFSKKTLNEFNIKKHNLPQRISNSPATYSRLIASPNLTSKFSPSVLISKSPSMVSKRISLEPAGKQDAQSILNKFSKNKPIEVSKNVLLKYSMNPNAENKTTEEVKEPKLDDKNIPVNRKNRNMLKNFEELPTNKINIISTSKANYSDLPITLARKQSLKENNVIDE